MLFGGSIVSCTQPKKIEDKSQIVESISIIHPNIIIAANNSNTADKVTAIASGGAVCDATDDEEEIQAAINIAKETGQRLVLATGTYNIQTTDLIVNCLVEGEYNFRNATYGTVLNLSAPRKIKITQHAGSLWNLSVTRPSASEYCVGIIMAPGEHLSYQGKVLDNVSIKNSSADQTGSGLYIESTSSTLGTAFVAQCQFGVIFIQGFQYGIHMKAIEHTNDSFNNGNIFNAIISNDCQYTLYLETGTGASQSGNHFLAINAQNTTNTIDCIKTIGKCWYNYFNFMPWDFHLASGKIINLDSNSRGNLIIALSYGMSDIIDNGSSNRFILRDD